MSDKIPTASQKLMDLKTYFKRHITSDGKKALNGYALWEDIPQVMIEFAKLHVEAALKAASEKAEGYTIGKESGKDVIIDKRTILNAYPKENIK